MCKKFLLRAAICVATLVSLSIVLEGQANAKLFGGRHHRGGSCCNAEASCGCAAEPSCGCAAEPNCGCAAEPSCGCSSGRGRTHRLFGHRHRGGSCGCESSCGAPAGCSSCGAPADAGPADGATPPAPEAPTT